jgi:hypothetical protein
MPSFNGLKIVTSSHLVEYETIPLTLLDSFFLWVERLCNEADIYYYWKKVQPTREVPSKKVLIIGNTMYIHPAPLITLKAGIELDTKWTNPS